MAMLGFLVFLFYLIYNYLNASGNAGRSGRKMSSYFSNFKLSNLTTRVLDALIRNNQKYELQTKESISFIVVKNDWTMCFFHMTYLFCLCFGGNLGLHMYTGTQWIQMIQKCEKKVIKKQKNVKQHFFHIKIARF